MPLFFEKIFPYLLALSAALLWWAFEVPIPTGHGIFKSSLTFAAILTGFLSTTTAILMTLDSPIMQRIRGTKYIIDLISYLGQAIWLSFGYCVVSLAGFFIAPEQLWFELLWVFIGVASAGAFIRMINIMLKIVKYQPKISV